MVQTYYSSPIGEIRVTVENGAVVRLEFVDNGQQIAQEAMERTATDVSLKGRDGQIAREASRQLEQYFRKERREFDLPLNPLGTDFQRKAWQVLRQIPYGETISYGEQARRMGSPKAARAVGGANHRNPLPLLIPCHRVVARHGIGGYGEGIGRKEYLLRLEGAEKASQDSHESQ